MAESNVKIECENCGKEVKNKWDLDRYGECKSCKVKDQETDMTVGDLNHK